MPKDHPPHVPAGDPASLQLAVSSPPTGLFGRIGRTVRAAGAPDDANRGGIGGGYGPARAARAAADVMQTVGAAQDPLRSPSADSGRAEAVRRIVDGCAERPSSHNRADPVVEMDLMLLASQEPRRIEPVKVSWLPPVLIAVMLVLLAIGLRVAHQTARMPQSIAAPSPGHDAPSTPAAP